MLRVRVRVRAGAKPRASVSVRRGLVIGRVLVFGFGSRYE